MKSKPMKKYTLALIFAIALSTGLAGCGQPAQSPSSSEPQSESASVAVLSGSQNSEDISSAAEEPEDAAPETPESAVSETESAESSSSAPDEIPPAESAAGASAADTAPQNDTAEPDVNAAPPASEESQPPAPESGSLSGIDLTVRFGDDGAPFVLHLYDNETAAAIAKHVGTADWRLPIYNYDGYDNWEVMQYYDIPSRYEIPSNPQSITSEKAGTVYYSEPNRIVLFFGDAEISSEYTPVGYIDYSQEFADAVANNPVLEGWGNKIVNISR